MAVWSRAVALAAGLVLIVFISPAGCLVCPWVSPSKCLLFPFYASPSWHLDIPLWVSAVPFLGQSCCKAFNLVGVESWLEVFLTKGGLLVQNDREIALGIYIVASP